ncbi:MAG TPA: sugar phosphate isomerase [Planctomycetes bacterium]|nr:sugar phosphate isomerase [Planctomycetota bacterium]
MVDDAQKETARQRAEDFVNRQRAFRLGALLTESSHPKTARLSQTIQRDLHAGLRMLLSVDEEIAPAEAKVFRSDEYRRLVDRLTDALADGKRVFFTGCGATGRLSILLEAAWREFWQRLQREHPGLASRLPDLEDRVFSVMAGGDFALIRSVEGFEDFPRFGRYQLEEWGVAPGDVVVAITEGGETPFVIGTAWQGLESGAEVFFVFNNPAELLCRHVERSRQVIEEPRITKLDLTTGPMAVAGSTRMQATSAELLVVGAALETALKRLLQPRLPVSALRELDAHPDLPVDYAAGLARLVEQLARPAAVEGMARCVLLEQQIYERKGLVTYAAVDYVLDVLTDTTERSPTFRIPPFRKYDDTTSARSWALVKNPLGETRAAWRQMLRREPRGLTWTADTYRRLDAPAGLQTDPPRLDNDQIYRFRIGNEPDPSRTDAPDSAWILIAVGEEARAVSDPEEPLRRQFDRWAPEFRRTAVLCVGPESARYPTGELFHVPVELPRSPLRLWHHLAIKLVLNTISTATMARMGRVLGNWMIWVEPSNKKLIDRGTRLIAELAGLSYEEACRRLFEAIEEVGPLHRQTRNRPSPVALALERSGVLDADRRAKGH